MRLTIPTVIAAVLTIVASVLNGLVVAFPQVITGTWHQFVVFGLTFLAAIGVAPLVGSAFRNFIHLSLGVATVVTVVAFGVQAALQTLTVDVTVKGVLVGVVTFLAGLGFGPAFGPAPRVPPVSDVRTSSA